MKYDKVVNPFYKSKAWRAARQAALQRDGYVCQDCLAAKRTGERIRPRGATVVHHIKPVSDYPDLVLDPDNLISLCDICHNRRHTEKGGHNRIETVIPNGVRIIKV